MKNKLIVLCPAHDVFDQRINRSLNILRDRYDLYLFYEEKYKRDYKKSDKNIFFLKNKLDYFRINKIITLSNIDKTQINLFVNESGILGLLIIWWWKKFYRIKHLIFDYHDWIPGK